MMNFCELKYTKAGMLNSVCVIYIYIYIYI